MTPHRLSASSLIILLIAIVGLTLPNLASANVSSGDHSVSSQGQTQSVTSKGLQNGEEARTASQNSGYSAKEPMSVYIITLKDNTTEAQFNAFKQKLIKQGAVIKYEYSIIKGFAVSIKPSQVQALKKDPLVKIIEKDQEVHTL
ncbi:hypothetical protein PtA15_17A138 [Puccinia triticina]|uniref:Inhibitor I9 domain-containing protein n=1 Tax=Puccinia triticina TaxID=208348 RepID=A0ABY7D5K5_9BASI|nr:uncharacterized protein PtA15_17A138 [Puccinia triticina]WAQ92656.1 hypothetical protein PtA15_17A138 [Puccinia triticina]